MFIPLIAHGDFLTLYPPDFVSLGTNDPYVQAAVQIYVQTGSSTNQFFTAPLHLPDGAKITGATVFYYDNSASSLYVWIGREKIYDGQQLTQNILTWSSSGAQDAWRNEKTTSVNWAYNTINNAGAIYYVQIGFPGGGDGASLRFVCVKVWYNVP